MLWLGLDTADVCCNHMIWTIHRTIQKREQYCAYVILNDRISDGLSEVLFHHFHGVTEENGKTSKDSRSVGQDMNPDLLNEA
jgi:hypothetical protein